MIVLVEYYTRLGASSLTTVHGRPVFVVPSVNIDDGKWLSQDLSPCFRDVCIVTRLRKI
jgi:hypothetical protein